jgi:WD40 repeat protein
MVFRRTFDTEDLIYACLDGSINRQDLRQFGTQRKASGKEGGTVWSLALSPDGKMLASGSHQGIIQLWTVPDLDAHGVLSSGSKFPVFSLAFSPDSKTLASGSGDGLIRLFDMSDPDSAAGKATVLKGHTGPVKVVLFSDDGKTLISGGSDLTICLWDLTQSSPNCKPIASN